MKLYALLLLLSGDAVGAEILGTAAILNQPDMPPVGAESDPAAIAKILGEAGIETRLLSASQLADPEILNTSRFDLVVIPTGQSFPARARSAFIHFLRNGGDFITLGGYAFNHLVVESQGKWIEEAALLKTRREEATSRKKSLLADGGFEAPRSIPLGGDASDAQWRRSGERAVVVTEAPVEGERCANASVPQGRPQAAPTFYLDLPAEPGEVYQVAGWLKTKDVVGQGFAYMAAYQYAQDGKLVTFRDFVTRRGANQWERHSFEFSPSPETSRIRIQLGLYRAEGAAWFDDIRVAKITGLTFSPMNTASGIPKDGLVTTPQQIGVFDPSFPLKRVRGVRAARGQHVVPQGADVVAPIRGWAASGVRGSDHARWVPLLESYDRYGRPRGAAAALLLNYDGFYDGSSWAYFGVESLDLFADAGSPMGLALQQTAKFLLQETYLHGLTTDRRLYRDGETVRILVRVANRSATARPVQVRFLATESPLSARRSSRVIGQESVLPAPQADVTIEAAFDPSRFSSDLYKIAAVLMIDGRPVDKMETGFVVEREEVLQSAADSRFLGNYFSCGDRPMFLFGSDTYSYTYKSAFENPLTWAQDHRAARDVGLNVYENLQYNNPGHEMQDSDWRAFRAMAQLTQKYNLVFMPGMLIGHNVAIDQPAVVEQSALCAAYAEHLRDTPALHYYINGDYHMQPQSSPETTRRLWNDWLEERYGAEADFKEAWGANASIELGNVPFPPPNSGRWDDAAAVDRLRFQNWLTRRWNQSHVAAVRRRDGRHPIMSEYYSRPFDGLDLIMTIDGQDVSNVGYFDEPIADIDNLPLKIRWNDLRVRGKGVCLGEYGVKTHPAWTVENGATHYHIVRTEEQQKQLFLAVAHYALGMGVSKIQNWCLRDSQVRVFPWGVFYPNQLIPKDVAFVHRNQSVVWRHFSPRYAASNLTVCVANNLRLGNEDHIGVDVAYRTFADLLALHYDFNVTDDHHLDSLTAETKVLMFPSPFAMRDDAYGKLVAWVKAGGALLLTGDISYDAQRRPTRRSRLLELAGVEVLKSRYANIERRAGQDDDVTFGFKGLPNMQLRPCVECRAVTGEVLGQTKNNSPVLVRNRIGAGTVYWLADPLELDSAAEASTARRNIYAAFLDAVGVEPLPVRPNSPWLHVMAQPTANGVIHVVFDTRVRESEEDIVIPTQAGKVTLHTRSRWPVLAAAANDGQVLAVSACGKARVDGQPLMDGRGLRLMLSLDGRDLRESSAVLVGPMETGGLQLPSRNGAYAAHVGEFRGGQWVTLETVDLGDGALQLDIDADRATCMILICEPSNLARWTAALNVAMTRPERIAGY